MTSETSDAVEPVTDATETPSQAQERIFTQREVDDMIAGMKANLSRKLLKPYEGLGDPSELRDLREQAERKRQEDAMRKGEYEKLMQELAAKKDAEIEKRERIIREYRVDNPLVTAAARARSVNPDQVRTLLRPYIRVNDDGEPEVIDDRGQTRYDDSGRPVTIDTFVTTWLQDNPHFVQATPATTQGQSAITARTERIDVTKLDMKDPEQRRIYAEYRKQRQK
jgi:hypothetical protein